MLSIEVDKTQLRRLSKALKDLDPELQKATRREFAKMAREVRDAIRSKMPRSGKSRPSAGSKYRHAQQAIGSGTNGLDAFVKMDKSGSPYVAWLDFGGTLRPSGRRRNTIRRPRVSDGRYFYPTFNRYKDEVRAEMSRLLDDALKKVGLK